MIDKYDHVLKVDSAYGNKKALDPRSWGKPAGNAIAARVVEVAQMLGSAGRTAAVRCVIRTRHEHLMCCAHIQRATIDG